MATIRGSTLCGSRKGISEKSVVPQLDDSDLSDLSDEEEPETTHGKLNEESETYSDKSTDLEDDTASETTYKHSVLWTKNDFLPQLENFKEAKNTFKKDHEKPIDYIKHYINEKLFRVIADCTNAKLLVDSKISVRITWNDIQRFFGMSVLMSCVGYPRIRMYWSKSFKIPLIADLMSRDKYFKIRSNLKLVKDSEISNDQKKANRLWKVYPVLEQVQQGCLRIPREQKVCVDKQMIQFSGQGPLKQFALKKPNPVGLKYYVLTGSTGIVLDFVIYKGKETHSGIEGINKCGPAAVIQLSKSLPPGTHIFCDRYFNSLPLIKHLLQKSIYVTGTILKNRLAGADQFLTDDKSLQKLPLGSNSMVVSEDSKIAAVKWFDNKPLTMLSSAFGVSPECNVKRWSKEVGKNIEIPCPFVVQQYNKNMGGVYLNNRMISYYRIRTRTRKWTVRAVMHLIDLAITNSWLEYHNNMVKSGAPKKDILQYLDFKMKVAESWIAAEPVSKHESKSDSIGDDNLQSHSSSDENLQPPSKIRRVMPRPSWQDRTSGIKHLPKMMDQKSSSRCRKQNCNGKTKIQCTGCKMYLCITTERNCFFVYHSR